MAKKHKKEKDKDSSKKKHRSRSRSKSVEAEVEKEKEKRKHHKHHHHKSKKRERKESSGSDDDVIFVPPPAKTAKLASPPPKKAKQVSSSPTKRASSPPSKSHHSPPSKKHSPPPSHKHKEKEKEKSASPEITPSSNSDASLSIQETNALRAKLGLKPLADSGASNGSSSTKDDFVHKPAENLTQKKVSEKLRSRLAEKKEKRNIEKKLAAVKGLGEGGGDDDVSSWVNKSRSIEDERRKAAMKAKELDEMDEVFGIGDLVEEEIKKEKHKVYSARNLRGLTVEHNVEQFMEGRAVILTLKDNEVLAKDQSDTLVNVNMIDDERHKKNVMLKKQKPYNFSGIDDMEEGLDEHHVLKKYDEEIEGAKKQNFQIGREDIALRKESIKRNLQEKANMRIESLALPELKLANEYYSPEEMKIKKPSKKKKIKRKMLTADDLLQDNLVPTANQHKSRGNKGEPMDVDGTDVKTEEESDPFLKRALKKAQSLKSTRVETIKVEEVLKEIKEEPEDPGSIVLNSTAEFCRTLGDIPTYGMAGNRDEEADELLDFEKDREKIPKIKTEVVEEDRGGWNDVEMDEKVVEVKPIEVPILEAEPDLGSGVAGALRMAVSKGYLEKETKNRPSASRISHLAAQNYSIDDKAHAVEDEKQGRRERYLGPTQDFKEKDGYKPNIKLEYIDDDGHLLSAKEAFRYLSHKFHGKGPGKNKVEKRMKKNEQEGLMKQMSSTDTPLGTLSKLQHKQKETHSPFVVLSGSKLNPTTLSKTKMMK